MIKMTEKNNTVKFEVEERILEMFEDPYFIDNAGYINENKMCDVLKDDIDYDIDQVWAIINELIDESLIIDPSNTEGGLKLNFEAIYGPLNNQKCYYGFANPPWKLIKENQGHRYGSTQ